MCLYEWLKAEFLFLRACSLVQNHPKVKEAAILNWHVHDIGFGFRGAEIEAIVSVGQMIWTQNEFDEVEIQFVANKLVTDTKLKHKSQNPCQIVPTGYVSSLWTKITSDIAAILTESN